MKNYDNNNDYDPFEEYINQKVHGSDEPNGDDSNEKNNDAFQSADDYWKQHLNSENTESAASSPDAGTPKNQLSLIALFVSIGSILLCCCSSMFVSIGGSIIAIVLAFFSKPGGAPLKSLNKQARAAIIISCISILLSVFLIIFYYYLYPVLLNDPAYSKLLKDFGSDFFEQQNSTSPAPVPSVSPSQASPLT